LAISIGLRVHGHRSSDGSMIEAKRVNPNGESMILEDGSRIAAVGGGPAGSMFSHFLLQLAALIDLDVTVDIYEPRDFSNQGPRGCNGCAGIISESLIQSLAVEGVSLPEDVVQRGIESYTVHTSEGKVRIATPAGEKRIAAVHRGSGPLGPEVDSLKSFDGFLLSQAIETGATHIKSEVDEIGEDSNGRPVVRVDGSEHTYDMLAIGVGVNSPLVEKLAENMPDYTPAKTTKTHIREFHLGRERVSELIGDSMHVFLLNIPRIEFAAIVPKGEHVTLCILGEDIDTEIVDRLMATEQVKACIPEDVDRKGICRCSPHINIGAATGAFKDRMVFIGDCGTSRLYKDGIGAAYKTAKAAATTVLFHGVSQERFSRGFKAACDLLEGDNLVGKKLFAFNHQLQRFGPTRKGIMAMIDREQTDQGRTHYMSPVLWDTFTGSGSYRSILRRSIHPMFLLNLARRTVFPGVKDRSARKGVD